MLSLPTRLGGLGLKIFSESAEKDHEDSKHITSDLQSKILGINDGQGKTRYQVRSERVQRQQEKLPTKICTESNFLELQIVIGPHFSHDLLVVL